MPIALAILRVTPIQGEEQLVGQPEVGVLDPESQENGIYIGREVPGGLGIEVLSTGVSRQHGVFVTYGSQWTYKDLESTNGSWLNGVKLTPGKQVVVRSGDALQIGDVGLKLVSISSSALSSDSGDAVSSPDRTLLIFARGEFVREFVVPAYGRAVSFGGERADFGIDSDAAALPSLVIEGRGDHVQAFTVSPGASFAINGVSTSASTILKDGDVLKLSHYELIFSDASRSTAATNQASEAPGLSVANQAPTGFSPNSPLSNATDWRGPERTERAPVRTPFGQSGFGASGAYERYDGGETISLSTQELKNRVTGMEVHPSMRGSLGEEAPRQIEGLEDRVILLLGIMLVVAVLFVFILWVLL